MRENIYGIIGLGYVGLPLALAFAEKSKVIGFDVNSTRVRELKEGNDRTKEASEQDLKNRKIQFTDHIQDLKEANFFIVTVPTPIDRSKKPDLSFLESASKKIGCVLSKGDYVVYESTVYPGVTEEVCVPILEQTSGLKVRSDFKVGYSPERINPGDKKHTIDKIVKVVAGCDQESLEVISEAYAKIVPAGIHRASSIMVAEAAKVIENTQRDLNIALMNELATIFDRLQIDTNEVIDAASTKWNFLPFRPGLVGGHCIGVDPYYLTSKAEEVGHHPEVILAGRRINDNMGTYIALRCVKRLINRGFSVKDQLITVLGATFKENCPDLRNSKVIDVVKELQNYGAKVQVIDPVADQEELRAQYGEMVGDFKDPALAHALILAVPHQEFSDFDLENHLIPEGVVIDVKNFFSPESILNKGLDLWRL